MTCWKCKYEFCWLCLRNYRHHYAETRRYVCNDYDQVLEKQLAKGTGFAGKEAHDKETNHRESEWRYVNAFKKTRLDIQSALKKREHIRAFLSTRLSESQKNTAQILDLLAQIELNALRVLSLSLIRRAKLRADGRENAVKKYFDE